MSGLLWASRHVGLWVGLKLILISMNKEEYEEHSRLQRKIEKYERLLHLLDLNYSTAMNSKNVRSLLDNISNWSRAHRVGNGMLSEEEQEALIGKAFDTLTDI